MIAKVGQIVPPKVEKKADVSKTEPNESFSKVLKKTSKEAEKSVEVQKKTAEESKKAEKSDSTEKCNQQGMIQEAQVCETNAQVLNQPVQENPVLNLVVEKGQTVIADTNQGKENLTENTVPVELKVSAMPTENLKQGTVLGEQSVKKVSDSKGTTQPLNPIETEKQISNIEVNPQIETSAKSTMLEENEVNVKTDDVVNVKTQDSGVVSKTNQKTEKQTEQHVENVSKTLEKTTSKEQDVDTTSKVEFANELKLSKSEKAVEKLEVSDAPVVKEQPQVIDEVVDKVFAHQDVQTKDVIKQVLKQFDFNSKQNVDEFSFDLHPKDLGKIAVKMAVKTGMLVVDLVASSEKAQAILANNAGEIESILQTQLAKQNNFAFVAQSSKASDYLQEQNSNHNQQQQQSQQQNNQQQNDSNEKSTQDFISMMNLASQFKF